MESLSNLISLEYNPKKDMPIICPDCGLGVIEPLNPLAQKNHSFSCSKCKMTVMFEESVEVE